MKKLRSLLSILLVLCCIVSALASCTPGGNTPEEPQGHVDYAAETMLDMNSTRKRVQVTSVKMYIDGDTTHFNIPAGSIVHTAVIDNVVKARYLAINTPESTGVIEPWGHIAADFTNKRLESAESIILESDTDTWNVDSTGDRLTVWVWYRTAADQPYRNLNLEILQAGLAIGSNAAGAKPYGATCQKAIVQAKSELLYVHDKTKVDPDYPVGGPKPMLLRDIRLNINDMWYKNVYFEGIISMDDSGTIYIESYDEETELWYGITAYYKTGGLNGTGLTLLKIGNKLKVVGIITYFSGGDIWQLSDLKYDDWNPNDVENIGLISEGHEIPYTETEPAVFMGDKTITVNGEEITKKYYELVQNTSISMKGLTVYDTYTQTTGTSKGAISLYCRAADGTEIEIRTNPMVDENGDLVLASAYMGKTLDVKGIVDSFNKRPQIQIFTPDDLTIVG